MNPQAYPPHLIYLGLIDKCLGYLHGAEKGVHGPYRGPKKGQKRHIRLTVTHFLNAKKAITKGAVA